MDFGYSEEQELLQKSSRDFLNTECTKAFVREMETDEKGYSPELWRKMADLGWMGLAIPEKYAGQGMSFLDLAVLLEEMGRACLPGPFFSSVILAGTTLLVGGSEDQKQNFLSKISNGEAIFTLALLEPSGDDGPAGVTVQAKAAGDGYVISGTKFFVADANVADYIICVARTSAEETGISLFIVDAKDPSVVITPLKTIGGDKQCEVVFKDSVVPSGNLVGGLNEGWPIIEKVLQQATVAKCAMMIGGAQQVLEMTIDYVKERTQFGKPIGAQQSVQHHCANMIIDVDGSKYITYQAAWMISDGLTCDQEVSIAKCWVSEAFRKVCEMGVHLHGAIGFTMDHDMQLYYRRAKAAELTFGDADHHKELVAQGMGL